MLGNWSGKEKLLIPNITNEQWGGNSSNEIWIALNFQSAERSVDDSQKWEFPKEFEFEWYKFVLFEKVFSPIVFKWSSIYVNHLPLQEHQKLLDMWCGSGIIWISALLKYNLDKVVCADINQFAVDNTIGNIKMHNINYDLIFWNAPYFDWDFDKSNILFRSMYDKNYEHIKRFILEWEKHLNEWGRIMLWFSSDRFPLEHAHKLVNEIWYDLKIFHQEADIKWIKQEILEVVKNSV